MTKSRSKRHPLRKADDSTAPAPEDITPAQSTRGADAKRQAADGHNPPSWAVDEDVWDKAKTAADKSYSEGDDIYWPAVVAIYQNMGGTIQGKSTKAMKPHADMKPVVDAMGDMDVAEIAQSAGIKIKRLNDLVYDGAKPTAAELKALAGAVKPKTKPAAKAMHAHDDMADVVEAMAEYGMSESAMSEDSGLAPARMKALLHEGEKPTSEEHAAMMDAVEACEKAKAAKAASAGYPAALIKAGLGMSDGEFRRMLNQAVYGRWGKQGSLEELFPETQVAIVRVWEGDVWSSAFRLVQVPYDAEDGAVTLGDALEEVRQTYEPVAKSVASVPATSSGVEYVAEREGDEYVISGLNGEARLLQKSLAEVGCDARVEDGENGSHRVVFSGRGLTASRVVIKGEADGEFDVDAGSARFVPYLRDDTLMRKADEKGIVYGVVYAPDEVDKQGEWANAEDIEDAAHDYLKRSRRMKRQHEDATDSEPVESYIAPADFVLGDRVVRKGSWVVAVQLGKTARELYKAGKLTGFSMGGSCAYAA